MFGLGFGEILIILFFALIFIGPKKLPEIAQNLGKGIREFNKARSGMMETIQQEVNKTEDSTPKIVEASMDQAKKEMEDISKSQTT